MVFKGTTSSDAISEPSNISSDIISFSIANKAGGNITISVALVYGSIATYLIYNKTLNSNDQHFYTGEPIEILPNYSIYVSFSGSADYYFTIK